MAETLLRVESVCKHFGGVYAVDGVNMNIREGGIWGLVGPNGSGKSTLFNTILGLHQPNSGGIYFKGQRTNNMAPHQIYGLGVVNSFQVPRLFPSLTVLDNMLVAARGQKGDSFFTSLFLREKWQKQEEGLTDEALDILELIELRKLTFSPAGELSGGQRKLLEIARALMAHPTLLLLDEPAAGINPVLGKKVFQKLQDLSRSGMTFFIVEHRLEILFEFASWIYVMDKGKTVAEGNPEDIVKEPAFYQAYLGKE
ncbi:MAG: ABC transporter ATP-binding protein [Chloroflexota bacterium]|nr:ABC transporter ATP-binding protein [Chloroflexota bacterium]